MIVKNAYASDDMWFVGEGVKKDMWVRYSIQQLDTVDDQPYIITLWFQQQDDRGNWMVPATVEYQGRVLQGTLRLSPTMAALGGGDNVPAEMNQYIGGYQSSLQWLDAYATKSSPKSLNPSHWGVIAQIGGSPIDAVGREKVSFAGAKDVCGADSCDAAVILWHKGVDNKVWIVNDFPFPVKADTFASVASGQGPTQFKFELLGTGTGKPPALSGQNEIPKPPLTTATSGGDYMVTLDWEPVQIQPNSTVNFGVTFADRSQFPSQNVNYEFAVTDANGKAITDLKDQRSAAGGPETHAVKVNTTGPLTITVTVNSVNGQVSQSGLIDNAEFSTVVVPEFPLSPVIVAAAVIGLFVIMTRAKSIGLRHLFGGKKAAL